MTLTIVHGGRSVTQEPRDFEMTKSTRRYICSIGLATLGVFATLTTIDRKSVAATQDDQTKTIVETAQGVGQFNTLVAAVQAAGLVETLQGPGPFTVFAPTDDAFAKLPEGTIASLLEPENKEELTSILTYHVVAGKVTSEQVVKIDSADSVNGASLKIKVVDGSVMINDAKVVTADILCSNGVIHVIDSVLLPQAQEATTTDKPKTIVETAQDAGQFNSLVAAVAAAGLVDTLQSPGPFTVFAPTDEAFAKLPAGTVESLLKPENKDKLTAILTYHVVAGKVTAEQVVKLNAAETVNGANVVIKVVDGTVMLNNVKVVKTDIICSNGVIHVIDGVLLPPSGEAAAMKIIETAIAQGANMYNSGHHAACATLYNQTINELMSTKVGQPYAAQMQTVLNTAAHQHSAGDKAWTLRRGLDRMYGKLQKAAK